MWRKSVSDPTANCEWIMCGLMAFGHGDYFALGKKVGFFGFR
jgi:hypothetical protein